MDVQVLRELETAAQILLASPNLVTNEQRHAAESVFLNFKKTKSPYNLCIQILETSKVDYVLFEVAGLLKDAIIREWSFLQESDITSLRQYLFQYVLDRPTLPPFVREKILQVIAIICKRGSLNDSDVPIDPSVKPGNHRELLLNEVEQLIMNGNHAQKLLGCSLLAAILQEYSVTVKSSDIGLSMETHFKAKENFGLKDLIRIFQFCCRALGNIGSLEAPFSNEDQSLIKHLLSISETVLTWDFGFTARYGMMDVRDVSSYHVSFIPGPSWKDVLLDPQVLNLFFTMYRKIRESPQLSHHALTCLVQFATVDVRIFTGSEEVNYIKNYVKEFMKLVTSIEILDREALGISNIINKIFLPCFALSSSLPKLNQEFFEQVTLLTCNFAQGAANEESICADDRLYMEAFDNMMDVWMNMLFLSIKFSYEYYKPAFQQIFNVYLKCHLAPPEGSRGQGRDIELEELDESDETDRVKFKTQLQTIGGIGQHIPEHCLPLLARLLEDRTKLLGNHMDKLYQQGPTTSGSSALVFLFEDLHWLLLISGNVIELGDEIPQIPLKLMNYSIAQSSTISIETTLKVFGSPNLDFSEIEGAEQKTDHLIRLISAAFRLGYLFKKFIESKLTQFLSPEVVSSLLWFLKEWSVSYLLPKESLYSEISMPLLYAFGRDSEGGVWTINYLLEQVLAYLMHFNSEPGVAEDAVKLFISLMDSKEKSACVLKSEYLPRIINLQPSLPKIIKRDIYQGLALASIACHDESSRNEYWSRIMKPLQDRWRTIVCHENFNRIYQEELIKTEIMEILDCLTGVVKGGRSSNAETIFHNISPIFSYLPTLVGVYRNYQQIIELVFDFFCECAKNLLSFLAHTINKKIYQSCIETIQTYAKCNVGRLSLDSDVQEETFNDVHLLLDLLTNLLPRDYFELSNLESVPSSEQSLMPADVCLYGLNLIMPLMTANLFKYPPLCLQYFKFIVNLSEMYPKKIYQLPEELLKNILTSVELGLTSFGQEIFPLCCKFLNLVATSLCKSNIYNEHGQDALKPFLKILIDLILSHMINSDHLPSAGSALFALICCYQEDYHSLVQALLKAQPPVIAEQLAKAFNSLTGDITMKYETQQQLQFSKNFDEFIAKTHGFLHIK